MVEGVASARVLTDGGGVCGRHREHTFCYPGDILGDRRRGRHDLRNCPHGPSPEGEVLLPGVRDVVGHVHTPCVTHHFDVERGAGLAFRIHRQRRDIDTC